jgi:hypothetical protein
MKKWVDSMLKNKAFISVVGWILITLGCIDFFYKLNIILSHPLNYDSFNIIFIELSRGGATAIIGSAIVIAIEKIKTKNDAKNTAQNIIKYYKSRKSY